MARRRTPPPKRGKKPAATNGKTPPRDSANGNGTNHTDQPNGAQNGSAGPGNGNGNGKRTNEADTPYIRPGTADDGWTCGDYGGKTPDGKMCTREAGWGTDDHSGPCRDHCAEGRAKMQTTKKEFLQAYARQPKTIRQAADDVGINFATAWRWRQTDPDFDAAVARLKDTIEPARVSLVEEALFVRCASAKASPVETIFYLLNKGGDRWIDKRRFEHTGKGGDPIDVRAKQVITFAGQEIEV